MISHIELRSEESIDVRTYVHQRKIEKVVVSLDGEIKEIREGFLKVIIKTSKKIVFTGFCSDSVKDSQSASWSQSIVCY